jgi:hypothetical protein
MAWNNCKCASPTADELPRIAPELPGVAPALPTFAHFACGVAFPRGPAINICTGYHPCLHFLSQVLCAITAQRHTALSSQTKPSYPRYTIRRPDLRSDRGRQARRYAHLGVLEPLCEHCPVLAQLLQQLLALSRRRFICLCGHDKAPQVLLQPARRASTPRPILVAPQGACKCSRRSTSCL